MAYQNAKGDRTGGIWRGVLAVVAVPALAVSAFAGEMEEMSSMSDQAFAQVQEAGTFTPQGHRETFPPRDGGRTVADGWELAGALCSTMGSGQSKCLSIVEQSRHFSVDAVLACGRIRSDFEKLRCVDLIADHVIASAEAKACQDVGSGAFNPDRAIADCFHRIVDRDDPFEPENPWDKPGLQQAGEICAAMRYAEDKSLCLFAISGAKYFAPEAVRMCNARWYDEQKTACLKQFKDLYLNPESIQICTELRGRPNRHRTNDQEAINCFLAGASDEPFDRRGPSEDPAGMREASSLCRSLQFPSRRDECVGVLASARFFTYEAVGICRGMISDGYKIECLSAVSNSRITRTVANACMSFKYEPKKIACLRDLSGKMR